MLRPYCLHHRELLGEMARLAYNTVREMMAVAVAVPDARPGMLGVIQTFASSSKWNPHIHDLATPHPPRLEARTADAHLFHETHFNRLISPDETQGLAIQRPICQTDFLRITSGSPQA